MRITHILENNFSSAHFYYQPAWSEEKNREIFGRCFTPYGHGHNYVLKSEWEIQNRGELEQIKFTLQRMIDRLDHEHLNFTIPEFKTRVPTTEMILTLLQDWILQEIPQKPISLELYETNEIGARVSGRP